MFARFCKWTLPALGEDFNRRSDEWLALEVQWFFKMKTSDFRRRRLPHMKWTVRPLVEVVRSNLRLFVRISEGWFEICVLVLCSAEPTCSHPSPTARRQLYGVSAIDSVATPADSAHRSVDPTSEMVLNVGKAPKMVSSVKMSKSAFACRWSVDYGLKGRNYA